MKKKYRRPVNCFNIVAPNVNSEIWNENLQEPHRMTDSNLSEIQLLNVSVRFAVVEAYDKR